MYQQIVAEFTKCPRDLHTVPLRSKSYTWFHVFVENGNVMVEASRHNTPKSAVRRRVLHEKECNTILEIYHRRLAGEKVSREAKECTYSQIYWYGIFSEMKL